MRRVRTRLIAGASACRLLSKPLRRAARVAAVVGVLAACGSTDEQGPADVGSSAGTGPGGVGANAGTGGSDAGIAGSGIDGSLDAGSVCPQSVPSAGAPCDVDGRGCTYPHPETRCCAGPLALCRNGAWEILEPPPTCSPCPAYYPPVEGSPCDPMAECGTATLECRYYDNRNCPFVNGTTAPYVVSCEGSRWQVTSDCPSSDAGAYDCAAAVEAFLAYTKTQTSCAADAECRTFFGPWCDAYFVNQSIDSLKWDELSRALNACLSEFGFYPPRCSEAPPPTPFCNAGTCDGRQL
jgi:hypothetical protein